MCIFVKRGRTTEGGPMLACFQGLPVASGHNSVGRWNARQCPVLQFVCDINCAHVVAKPDCVALAHAPLRSCDVIHSGPTLDVA
jgi:hypothetical protein